MARPIPVLRVNDGDVMLGAAEAGPGLALLPTFLAGEALAAGRLEVVDVGTAAEVDTLQVVYPKTRGVPGKVSAPVESLRASFGDPPYWDAKISGTTPPA